MRILGDPGAVSRVRRKGARHKIGCLYSDVFERRTSTERGLFALLSRDFEQIFGQIRHLLAIQIWLRQGLLKEKKAHFQLTCFAQKRRCLSSVFAPARFYIRALRCGALHNPST